MLRRMLLSLLLVTIASNVCALDFTEDSLALVKRNVDKEKAVLIDVRSQYEWDKGHVKGAIFLPITRLEKTTAEQLTKILPKKKILYTYCAVGMRAHAAGEILEEHGFEVRVLQAGYEKLVKAGFAKALPQQSKPISRTDAP